MVKLQKTLLLVTNNLKRVIEEILPIVYFYYIDTHLRNKIYECSLSQVSIYSELSTKKIKQRLVDEHDRAIKIDNKTSKFTLGLSISLTIISVTASSIVKFLPANNLNTIIVFLFGLSSLYMLTGGVLALGSLKTLPIFGYGTSFEINKNSSLLVRSLIGQEKINTLRHIRNELSYMSLRNGFIIIFMALFLCVVVFYNQISFIQKNNNIGDVIYYFCSSFV
jgi:hypothetical protein